GATLEAIASGLHLRGYASRTGYRPTEKIVEKIFRNPIYKGLMVVSGEVARGRFTPLVSEEVWDQVQNVGKPKDIPTIRRAALRAEFPLRRFVSCGVCLRHLTGSKP